ncbi:CDP-alcohol phosphatidyltransferase family protein [Rhodohalobacter sp. 8-1]|uniref:CDP-alcohol phosphatidyltransferase family protein n=1 Tax=Rhodohalobacter sp. 8-1 TaxID=3131972 RepID=UPI0030EF3E80
MSKLSKHDTFIDLSDYGRPFAVAAADKLKNTSATPIQVTLAFGIAGLIAVYCILAGYYIIAGIFLILKSIIDAMDGELARMKKRPSYTGRYLDSVFDFILNFIIFIAIWSVGSHPLWAALLAIFSLQLQGTLYNYYYVILRHHSLEGDRTSKIFETSVPEAYPQESQAAVNWLFKIYRVFYSAFDKIIYALDRKAPEADPFPKWFMCLLSVYGLGFQLLIIAILLAAGLINLIIPFFIIFSVFIFLFIGLRRFVLTGEKQKQMIYRD